MRLCLIDKCSTMASFNFRGLPAIYCSAHREPNMANVNHKLCLEPSCNITATFSFKDEPAEYCVRHKLDGMVGFNHKYRHCRYPDCNNKGMIIEKRYTLYCVKHYSGNTPKRGQCIYKDCKEPATHNKRCSKKPLYCLEHKSDGMISVKHRKCIANDCCISASFNVVSSDRPLYCFKHKYDGMVNIRSSRCLAANCINLRLFGLKKPVFCSEHKLDGMIQLIPTD